jgi:hypothetical protein
MAIMGRKMSAASSMAFPPCLADRRAERGYLCLDGWFMNASYLLSNASALLGSAYLCEITPTSNVVGLD